MGFVLALLDDLAARTPVDRARIYATGLSNGSMMAYRLAAEASGRVAAVAGVAGAMTLPRFSPARPVPVMHIHSVDDGRALYDGGLGPAFPFTDTRVLHNSVDAMLGQWLRLGNAGPQRIAIMRAGGCNVRHRERDMVQTSEHLFAWLQFMSASFEARSARTSG